MMVKAASAGGGGGWTRRRYVTPAVETRQSPGQRERMSGRHSLRSPGRIVLRVGACGAGQTGEETAAVELEKVGGEERAVHFSSVARVFDKSGSGLPVSGHRYAASPKTQRRHLLRIVVN